MASKNSNINCLSSIKNSNKDLPSSMEHKQQHHYSRTAQRHQKAIAHLGKGSTGPYPHDTTAGGKVGTAGGKVSTASGILGHRWRRRGSGMTHLGHHTDASRASRRPQFRRPSGAARRQGNGDGRAEKKKAQYHMAPITRLITSPT